MESENKSFTSLLDRPLSSYLPRWNTETLLIALILVLAVISRFHNIDLRVMSHDEVNHVVPSWELFRGKGYRHDPVTHGPFQFHLVSLSYFLLGDNDFSARVPAALFSIAAVGFILFAYRRYLGRTGAIIAGFLFLISPYMLYYGRYTRNEAFIELFGVLTLYAVLRYLDKGDRFSLFLLTITTVLHFTTKETAFIYCAQLLLFIGILFLVDVLRTRWTNARSRSRFVFLMILAIFLLGAALGFGLWDASISETVTPAPESETDVNELPVPMSPQMMGVIIAVFGALVMSIFAIVIMVRSLGWLVIRSQRSFDILILVGTLILPQLSAFPVRMIGWDPLDYTTIGMVRTAVFIAGFFIVSTLIGLWWRPRFWLVNAVIFYGIFIVLYTTFFTNGQGFFTGLIGSLGYWLSQQAVERGEQPWYYYVLIQIPIYEYLAALGTMIACYFGIKFNRFKTIPGFSPAHQPSLDVPDRSDDKTEQIEALEQAIISDVDTLIEESTRQQPIPILALLFYWSVTSLIAYSIAGEKMAWLTVHIAIPLLLTAGWGLGYLVDTTPWKKVANRNGLIALLLIPVLLTSLGSALGSLLGNQPPFQGNTLDQLQATSTFLLASVGILFSGGVIVYLLKDWNSGQVIRLVSVTFFGLLTTLTVRASFRASYINYDGPTEYLVYAHAARGPKDVLEQVEEISRRTTGGKDIEVAYDNDGLYPYWWYLRDYPNHRWYTDKPTRDLREAPLIIAGDSTSGKMEPIVKDSYVKFDYIRLWWPNQDYYNLTWERIRNAITDPQMRTALFQIWLNRDYTLYAEITNNSNLKLEDWQPSSRMSFYIRKDVVNQMWNYGVAPAAEEIIETDPYESGIIQIIPDSIIGSEGTEPELFQAPRGLAVAPDDSIYVADSNNHRIQHFSASGEFLHSWGSFADATAGTAPGGTFYEPWGLAVGADGSVYVADTWNHRIQKFTADGKFVTMWGYFGQAEANEAFWGPRDVTVDHQGRVYVTDTGNKRIVVFSSDGKFISEFGEVGVGLGEFDEPVGLAFDENGLLYVVDTWNQRIQVFSPDAEGNYKPIQTWDIYGWFGQSLDNKPFIAIDDSGNIYITDPDGYRIIKFDKDGEFILTWGDYNIGTEGFNLPVGIAVDSEDRLWVSDSENNRLLRFTLP